MTIAKQIKQTAINVWHEASRRAVKKIYLDGQEKLRCIFADGSYITFKQ